MSWPQTLPRSSCSKLSERCLLLTLHYPYGSCSRGALTRYDLHIVVVALYKAPYGQSEAVVPAVLHSQNSQGIADQESFESFPHIQQVLEALYGSTA